MRKASTLWWYLLSIAAMAIGRDGNGGEKKAGEGGVHSLYA